MATTKLKTLLGVGVLVCATPAWSQNDAQRVEKTAAPIEEIEVIGYVVNRSSAGTKTNTSLLETPQSLTVVSSEQLTAQAVRSVAESLRYVGGVTAEPRGAMTALDYFYARGFLLNQFVDGLKTLSGGYSLPQPDPYLLERVEVLRGPASVLYGQAEPGGVLNLVSKRPSDTPFSDIELQAGSRNRIQGGIDIGNSLSVEHNLTGRLTAVVRDADTQVDHAQEQRLAIAPALSWRPSERTSLTVLANYQDDPQVGYYNWITAYGTVLANPAHPGVQLPTNLDTGDPNFDKYARKSWSIGGIFEQRLSDTLTFRQNLRVAHVESEFDKIYASYLDSDYETLNRYAWHLRDGMDALTSDTQLQAIFSTGPAMHTVLAGIDYSRSRYNQLLGHNFDSGTNAGQVPPLDIYHPVYGIQLAAPAFDVDALQKQHQTGVYLQDQVKINRFNLLLGGRHDSTYSRTAERVYNSIDEQRADAFTGRAGAVYVFDNGVAPYVSYTESFQPVAGTDFAGNPFEPTTGVQQEAGIKFQPKNANSFVMLSIYNLKQQNVLANDVLHPRMSVQTGEIRSRGYELSGAVSFSNLDLIASVSHVDQEVTKGGVSFGPAVGKTPAAIPADNASIWADYAIHAGALTGFGFGAGVRRVGSSWGDDDNTFKVPSSTIVDAFVHYEFAEHSALTGWTFRLNITNLLDKTYIASCGGTDYCGYGLRRAVLATMSKHW